MDTSRDHVLKIAPTFLLVFRSLQLATAVIVLGLTAYGENYLSFDGDGLMLFTVYIAPHSTPIASLTSKGHRHNHHYGIYYCF
jgi:hypothetical protein